ncbi:MAG TPA: amidohydrolase family protein [Polyangiaceae bacterium]|jgi:cytosine/adenosine deaminase-related metal-dependent hydrolase
MRILHADWVLPGDAPPIADGAIALGDDGAVARVGPAAEIGEGERVRGLLMPGLVNAHTHVELSALRGRVPGGGGFLPWVERLIGARLELGEGDEESGIASAVAELRAAGTSAVGEVTNGLGAVLPLARAGIAGCIFHEVFGQDLDRLRERMRGLEAELRERVPTWPTPDLAYAPAPHTLYTLHLDVVRMIVDECRARGRRTSLHLLEHAVERRAIERGEGPVIEWLAMRSRVDPAKLEWPKKPVLDVAADVGALSPDVLLVHLTEARPDELARIAAARAPVVLCPRSNLFIEGKLPPLLAMREAGLEPALGTDSLASSASLDVLREAVALRDRFPSVPPFELVKMATWNGARALGLPRHGRIAPGARPGIVAIDGDLPRECDPCAWLLANVKAPRRFLA